MDAAELKAQYADVCQQPLKVRRYTGTPRTATDYDVFGNATLYAARELLGTILQGDQRVIVLADNLTDQGFTFPLTTSPNDKIVVNGKELAIIVVGTRDALDGTLIAYELTARG